MNVIRRIKEEFDWEDYVETHYMPKRSPNSKNGLELRICCPNCGDTKYKCYINPELKAFNCYKCDFNIGNYDLFHFISVTEGITRGQALLRCVREFTPTAPEELPDDLFEREDKPKFLTGTVRRQELPPCVPAASLAVAEIKKYQPQLAYLQARGFTVQDLKTCNIHFAPRTKTPIYNANNKFIGDINNRIILPIYYRGYLAGWQARGILSSHTPKYINCPDSDISKTLWPFSPPKGNSVVLVEGIIDALSVRRVEGVSAYATFSKAITQEQINILKEWKVTSVTLWWDKKDAQSEMETAVEKLKMQFSEVYVLDLSEWPKDKDTGNFLSDTNGSAIIKDTLNRRINVYSDLEYAQWTKSF